jgi:hypothetical protein
MRRRWTLTLAAFVVAVGNYSAAGESGTRPATWLTVLGLSDRATLTSICGDNFCEGTDESLVGRLPVTGRDLVRVRIRPAAGRVRVFLVRLRRNGTIAEWLDWQHRAREVEGSNGHRWRFRLPAGLGDANAVHLFLNYPNGAPYPDGRTVRQATYTSLIVWDDSIP